MLLLLLKYGLFCVSKVDFLTFWWTYGGTIMDHWRVLLVKPSKVKILYKYYGRYESYVYYHVIHIYTLVIFSQNHIPARYLHASACFFCHTAIIPGVFYIFGWTHIHLKATSSSLPNGHAVATCNHPRLWLLIPLPLCEKRFWRLWLAPAISALFWYTPTA